MDIGVNYRNKKKYNTGKPPRHPAKFWTWLIHLLCKIILHGKDYKIEKINTEGLKPPYMMLSNHMYFIDFEIAAMATYPDPVVNVVSMDGYYLRWFLLEWIGSICTRKYTTDIPLIKNISKALKGGAVLSMYPEARYTPCGTTSFLPEALGKLVKMNKVPVVAVIHRGNHLHTPFWNHRNPKKVPMRATFKLILTPEQIAKMSVEEINAVIKQEFQYDDYRYQKENGILIKEENRAEGLHKVLYQCPHCKAEFKMDSKGSELFCTECGKRWTWREDGYLEAQDGNTEFDHIPDWYEWEHQNVRKEVENGTYHYEDEVDVYSLPRVLRFIPLGKAKVTHNIENGMTLEGFYRGERYYINRRPAQMNSLHVEYDYGLIGKGDCYDISNETDSFYCHPAKQNMLTKLAFATEEIYLKHQREAREALKK